MSQFLTTENAVVFMDCPLGEVTHNNANTDFNYYNVDSSINAYVYDGAGVEVFNDTLDNIGGIGATYALDTNGSSFRIVFPPTLFASPYNFAQGLWAVKLNTNSYGTNHALNSTSTFQWGAGYQQIYQNAYDANVNAILAYNQAILAKSSADAADAAALLAKSSADTAALNAATAASNASSAAASASSAETAALDAKDASLKAVDLNGGNCTFNSVTGVVTFASGSFRLKNNAGPVTSPQDATGRDSSTY